MSLIRTSLDQIPPAKPGVFLYAGFIKGPERQIKNTALPFQNVWIMPDFDMSGYQELYVAPVNTDYMLKMDWLHKMSSANWFGGVKKDIDDLAVYFHNQVVKEFNGDPKHRFQNIKTPVSTEQPALSMELALIEIDPLFLVRASQRYHGHVGVAVRADRQSQTG